MPLVLVITITYLFSILYYIYLEANVPLSRCTTARFTSPILALVLREVSFLLLKNDSSLDGDLAEMVAPP